MDSTRKRAALPAATAAGAHRSPHDAVDSPTRGSAGDSAGRSQRDESPVATSAAASAGASITRLRNAGENAGQAAREWLAPLVALVLLLRVVMGPAFFSSTRYFGLPGDTNQYMWFIGWLWRAIGQGQSLAVTNAFNYPTPIQVMDYTAVPTLGLLFGWLYPLAGMVFTFNLIVMVNYALILVLGKLTLRALGVGRVMSSVGGLLFCLMPYLTAQGVEHLNLAFVAPLFLIGYCIVRVMRSEQRPGWRMGALLGVAIALAFYTFVETTLTTALCIAILYGWSLLFAFRATYQLTMRVLNVRFLLGAAAPMLLIIPGIVNFLQGAGPSSPFLSVISYSTLHSNSLLSLVVPSQFYLAHNHQTMLLAAHFWGNPTEWDAYLSVPFLVLIAVFALRHWRAPSTRILALAGLSLLVLSLGPRLRIAGAPMRLPLPWRVVVLVPILREALPSRLGLYVLYLTIILVVRGIDELAQQLRQTQQAQRTQRVGEALTDALPLELRIGPSVRSKTGATTRLKIGLGASLMALALTTLLWLPSIPPITSSIPKSAGVLRSDAVVSRYIQQQPTLVLHNQHASYGMSYGFNEVMGVLADASAYDLVTSNVYGRGYEQTASYKINDVFTRDTDGQQTTLALRQYLPQIGVGKVMFLSINDQPIDSRALKELSSFLGAPVYDGQGLVVVWTVPQHLQASSQAGAH